MLPRLTEEEVRKRVRNRHGGRIRLLEYAGNLRKNHSQFLCSICAKQWSAGAESVFRGSGCPHCAGNAGVSEPEMVKRIEKMHGGSLRMTRYEGTTQGASEFECMKCGRQWKTTAYSVSSGTGCAQCAGNLIVPESEIRARLFEIHGTKLRLVAYGGAMTKKSSFECDECGLVWETTASGPIYQRSGCPRCSGQLVYEEEVRARLQETQKGQVEMLVYGGGRFKYSDFKCKVCEYEWEAVPSSTVYKGSGCPKCTGHARVSEEEMRERIYAEHGDDVRMTEYGGKVSSYSQFLCTKCGHSWSTKAQNVYDVRCGATGCPACSKTGLDPAAPAWLYYMRVAGEQGAVFFKVGITNCTNPMDRFRREPKGRVEHLRSWRFDKGNSAYQVEQFALKSFSPFHAGFTDEGPLRRSSGNTELFTTNFLQDLERMVRAICTHTTNSISGDSYQEMPQLEMDFEQHLEIETLRLRTRTELLNRPQMAV